jgi:phosphoribosyl 1,2-cyclic phosphate phosphodiesterase
MKISILGSGTSTGIPQIGCGCKVCTSSDPKDNRLRASIMIEVGDKRLLVDCGPDLRQQLINHRVTHLDGILITHEHFDHIGGLDDVRPLGETNIYGEDAVLDVIKRNMPYSFVENKYPGVPVIHTHPIGTDPFYIKDIEITPVRIMHAQLPILGFRIGNFAYLTDVKTIDKQEVDKLKGLDLLIINALRIREHHSHLSLSESLELTHKIGAKATWFTHMSHDMGLHDEIEKTLPENIHLAYDRLVLHC